MIEQPRAAFLATGNTRILVDAGLSMRELSKRLAAIGEDLSSINAILITHEHSDHVAGLHVLAKKLKIPVYITGATHDSYPVDVTIAPPERQSRWITLFRTFLALPAFLLAGALAGAMVAVGILGWLAALAPGQRPTGLRNLGAMSIRYQAQTHVYWFVLNDRYPYASPALRPPAEPEAIT